MLFLFQNLKPHQKFAKGPHYLLTVYVEGFLLQTPFMALIHTIHVHDMLGIVNEQSHQQSETDVTTVRCVLYHLQIASLGIRVQAKSNIQSYNTTAWEVITQFRNVACLMYVICVCLRIVVSNTYCVVFLLCFLFVLCPLCCHFLSTVLFLIFPSVLSNVY